MTSDFLSWLCTFQDAKQAARAAYDRCAQLAKENAELRAAALWHDAAIPPDDEALVLLETSDGEVYPGFYSVGMWSYADAMPVSAVEVVAWRHLPASRVRQTSEG